MGLNLYVTMAFLLFLLIPVQIYECVHVSKSCLPDQKLRWFNNSEICCVTVRCQKGQKFEFCSEDQGHDTCQNCPVGYTNFDETDTSEWTSKVDPCIEEEDCSEYSDLTTNKETGQCECDRSHGYYGRDRNKCALDDGSCKKAGYMLTIDGECIECDEDHFKTHEGYGLCQEKTRCSNEQEVDDPGSPRRDRTCRAKSSIIMSTIKPAFTSSNFTNGTSLGPGGRKIGDYNTSIGVNKSRNGYNPDDLERSVTNEEKNKNNPDTVTIIAAVVSPFCGLVIILVATFILYKCYQKRKQKGQEDNGSYQFSLCVCCHSSSVLNVTSQNLIIGDNNQMVDQHPGDEGANESTPLKEIVVDEEQRS